MKFEEQFSKTGKGFVDNWRGTDLNTQLEGIAARVLSDDGTAVNGTKSSHPNCEILIGN